MTRVMHVVLTPLYPPVRFGGIEKIVQQLAQGLARIGGEVLVVSGAGRPAADAGDPHVRWAAADGVWPDPARDDYQEAMVAAALSALSDSIGTSPVIHAHDWFVAPAALRLAGRLDAPVVAVFHGDKHSEYGGVLNTRRRLIHARQAELARVADRVLCYSDYMRRCVASSSGRPADDIELFRCGLDGVDADFSVPTGSDVLYLGRLALEKGVDTLIEAFGRITRDGHRAQLRIVGSGPTELGLRTLAEQLTLGERVRFFPFTADQAVVDAELRRASALVLPSNFEPFGLVLLEAISRGVPVIACADGGPAEIITDGVTGRLFPAGDDERLATILAQTLAEPEAARALAAAGLQRLRADYTWSRAAATLHWVAASTLQAADARVA